MRRPTSSPHHRLLWPAPTFALVACAAIAGWVALAREGAVRYTGVARVELPLPSRAARSVDLVLPGSAVEIGAAPLDLSLTEDGPFGPLPRIGPDGRRALFEYARPFNFEDARPKVAVLLLGLGPEAELFEAALALPGPIGLQLSPYAPDLPVLVERARRAGHEVLLDLPMEHADDPASDRGPHALLANNSPDENLQRLNWLLARAPGYIAVAGGGARFAGSDQVGAVLDMLARRGLALVELGASQLADAAAAAGLPYASAARRVDQDTSVLSTDQALAGLEAEALAAGSALGVVQGYPASLERLRVWAAALDAKGLVLAPVSAVLIEQAGLARGANGWPARRRPA
jgi:polysaccharide deacetylase 2 family uncharacterized protein YibQ